MTKPRPATPDAARERILEATQRVVTAHPAASATIDQVAEAAGCAKGLVHYHFKTKDALLGEVVTRIWTQRARAWREVLSLGDAGAALDAAWQELREEANDRRLVTSTILGLSGSELAGQSGKSGRAMFTRSLTDSLVGLFAHMARVATVPTSEIAVLLASLIEGLGLQLAGGEKAEDLEPAWSAFWAAVLSLTRPR